VLAATHRVFDAAEEVLRVSILRGRTFEIPELTIETALFFRERARHHDVEIYELIAATRASEMGHALAAHADHLAVLRTGGNADFRFRALDRRNVDLVAERGLRWRQAREVHEIVEDVIFASGYDTLRAEHAALIYCTVSGYGRTGPEADKGGFDLVAQGVSGLMRITGEPGGPPTKVGSPVTDINAGIHAALGIVVAYVVVLIVVPLAASVLSAWGMLNTGLRVELARGLEQTTGLDIARLRGASEAVEAEGLARLPQFTGTIATRRAADMRYGEQVFEVTVDLDGLDLASPDAAQAVAEAFHARHAALYTYAMREQEPGLVLSPLHI